MAEPILLVHVLWLTCVSCLDLGRYGPFRALDRKPVTHFDVKSFILGYEPSEWCFGVDEKLFDRQDQIIDITDDLTGKPHELAQENIPMHGT